MASDQFDQYQFYLFCSENPIPHGLHEIFKPRFHHLSKPLKTNDVYPDLIINFSYEKFGDEILELYPEVSKTGLTSLQDGLTIGRWAQTFFAQISLNEFAPFSAFDLFYRSITGQVLHPKEQNKAKSHRVFIDTQSFEGMDFNIQLIKDLVKENFQVSTDIEKIDPQMNYDFYIGANPIMMKFFNFFGVETIFFTNTPNNTLNAAPYHMYELGYQDSFITLENILQSQEKIECAEWERESLGGSLYKSINENQTISTIFNSFNYLAFNFINSGIDVNLPLRTLTDNNRVQLQNALSFLKKIHQLNLFAIKALHEFLQAFNDGNLSDDMIDKLKEKIIEVDQLSENSIKVFNGLDFFNTYYKIAKTSAQGENIIEISKSLILIYHEMNQVIDVYEELINKVIQGVNDEYKQTGHA